MLSRESSFLFNNLILLVACVAVLAGTLFPVLSEAVRGSKISVGPPFFNRVNIPIAMFLLFLTGVGPLLAWRKTSVESLQKNFGWPLIGGVVVAAIAVALGLREFYVTLCLLLSVFVTLTISGNSSAARASSRRGRARTFYPRPDSSPCGIRGATADMWSTSAWCWFLSASPARRSIKTSRWTCRPVR